MIPLLAIPVLNHRDLLDRTLASIDAPVDRLVVIDNSAEGICDDLPDEIEVTQPPSNLGVAASWNLAIRSTPGERWWCLVNADVTFAPGALEALAGYMDAGAPLACLVEFGAFGISADCIDTVGWFDENFHPIYCEDTDYRRRCALAGVPILDIPNGSSHVGSVSYRGNSHAADNARTYPANVAYYRAKWGGWIGGERFATPFDRGGSVADCHLDRRRLAAQAWGD